MVAIKQITLEQLKSWTPEQRKTIYHRAKNDPKNQYIVDLIEQHGLPLSSGGLTLDNPVHVRMVEIAWSEAGKTAAIEATNQGLPALCGVDKLLTAELGNRYSKYDLGTASAGAIVAEVMRHLGYKEAGPGSCPPGCTARSGMKWK